MIGEIVLQVLKASVFTSLLIGLLLASVPLLRKRYRAKWRYIVWLVIALRLIIPVNLTMQQAPINIVLPEQAAIVYAPVEDIPQTEYWLTTDTATESIAMPVDVQAYSPTPQVSIPPIQMIGFVWLAGVVVFLMIQTLSYRIFKKKLETSQAFKVPAHSQEMLWHTGVDMGVCKLPELIITEAAGTPVMFGILHPCILLPPVQYTDEELAFILRHELVHYRRKDMWYKLSLMLANALHWFNPVIYLMTAQACKDIELACDDDVTVELDRDARARYGDAILSVLSRKRGLGPVFSTQFGSNQKNMQSRLNNLFDTTLKRRGIAALCAVVAGTLTLAGIVTFGYAANAQDTVAVVENTATGASADTVATGFAYTTPVQNSLPDSSVHVYASDGTWAAATGIEGETWQEQVSQEIRWLDEIYTGLKSGFVITETLPKPEVPDVSRIQYLYENSAVFRGMSRMNGGVYAVENRQNVTSSGLAYNTDMMQRTAVMIENSDDLVLDMDYTLTKGKLSVMLIDPDGEIEYKGALANNFQGSLLFTGKAGLWSVIRIIQGEGDSSMSGNGTMSGSVKIALRQPGHQLAATNNPDSAKVDTESVSSANLAVWEGATDVSNDLNPSYANGGPYFQIVCMDGKNVASSGSFQARDGQMLTISVESSIKGGTVDLSLFSPSFNEQQFTFGGANRTVTVTLSAGTWAYNCTGFFDSGTIRITGTYS